MTQRWVDSGWGYAPKRVDELMRLISRINTLQAGTQFVWRGVTDASWKIESSLQLAMTKNSTYFQAAQSSLDVDKLRAPERRILESARAWGVGLFPSGFVGDLQLLAVLQHHGAPTRLIDVTPDPMTALWFACEDERFPHPKGGEVGPSHQGALFAFNVTDMDAVRSIDPPRGMQATWHDSLAAGLESCLIQSEQTRRPLLLRPAAPDARMTAQQGQFLFGATETGGIAEVPAFPSHFGSPPGVEALTKLAAPGDRERGRPRRLNFVAIVISPSLKRKSLSTLKGYNRSSQSLFPDLGGFVENVKRLAPDALISADDVYLHDVIKADAEVGPTSS